MKGEVELLPIHEKKLNWNEANKLCERLNDGWRLPTPAELHLMYEKKVDGLNAMYWSSCEYVGDFVHYWDFTLEHPRVMANHKGCAMNVVLIRNI